jgi:hypothetical protein
MKKTRTPRIKPIKKIKPLIVNKNLIDVVNQPVATRFHTAMDVFFRDGTAIYSVGETTLAHMANDILNAMGVTMEERAFVQDSEKIDYNGNYSFQSDAHYENNRIVPTDIKDKFPATDDPIYNQDEEPSEREKAVKIKARNVTMIPLIKIADKMIMINNNESDVKYENKYLNAKKTKQLRRTDK